MSPRRLLSSRGSRLAGQAAAGCLLLALAACSSLPPGEPASLGLVPPAGNALAVDEAPGVVALATQPPPPPSLGGSPVDAAAHPADDPPRAGARPPGVVAHALRAGRAAAGPEFAVAAAAVPPDAVKSVAPSEPPVLVEARLAHHVPTQMHLGRTYPVDLWLDLQQGATELGKNMALQLQTDDPSAGASGIRTGRLVVEPGNEVVAELIVLGDEFKVMPDQPVAQPVLAHSQLRWQWLVQPLKTGQLKLQVRVAARISGRESGLSTPYLGSVTVSSWPPENFSEFIELATAWLKQLDGLLSVLGTSVAAAMAYFLRRWAKAKNAG